MIRNKNQSNTYNIYTPHNLSKTKTIGFDTFSLSIFQRPQSQKMKTKNQKPVTCFVLKNHFPSNSQKPGAFTPFVFSNNIPKPLLKWRHTIICGDSTALCHLIVFATRLILLFLIFVPICMYFLTPTSLIFFKFHFQLFS